MAGLSLTYISSFLSYSDRNWRPLILDIPQHGFGTCLDLAVCKNALKALHFSDTRRFSDELRCSPCFRLFLGPKRVMMG